MRAATSGLDSFAAHNVVKKLVELSTSQGCNVLCTIHQPSSEVFHTFNHAMLLYKGKSLFFGSIRALSAGFASNGVGCPAEYNLADHSITLIQTTDEDKLDKLKAALAEGANNASDAEVGSTPSVAAVVADDGTHSKALSHNVVTAADGSRSAAGFLLQLYALSGREALYVWRNKPGLIASILVPLLLNFFFAGIFGGSGDPTKADYSIQGHFGGVAQVAIGAMFGAAQPLLLRFPLDRGIFLREYATSTYGAVPYFLSKTVVEVPQALLQATLVMVAFYFVAGLEGSFLIHVIVLWLTSMAAASTALLVGCLAANAEVAIQSSPPIFVLQLLFAGVFIPTSQIPSVLRWIQYGCSLKYGINLIAINEFGHVTQAANNWTATQRAQADFFLESISVVQDDWAIYLIVLLSLLCLFRCLAVIALARRASAFF